MSKPSILMTLSNYRGFGGHEIVINNLCTGLKKIGYQTAIGAFNFLENPPDDIEKVKLSRIGRLDNRDTYAGGFDIIHNHHTLLNYYSLLTNKPFLFHYHGTGNRIQEVNVKVSVLLCGKRISRIISVSNSGVQKLKEIVGRRIIADTIYNGIDTKMFNTDLPKLYAKGQPQLLFVGVLYPTKNVRTLINKMPEILQVFPNAHLQIVGEGSEYDSLDQLIKHLGLKDKIELVGRQSQSELPLRYSSCDVYLSASIVETMPLPPFEAMACGKPVLLSDIPAHKEIVTASDGGLTFAPGEGSDIVGSLQEVYSNKENFGVNARKFAEKYDWAEVCQQVSKIYEQIMIC